MLWIVILLCGLLFVVDVDVDVDVDVGVDVATDDADDDADGVWCGGCCD